MMDTKTHWESIYHQKKPDQVSWFKPHLDLSLRLLVDAGLNPLSCIIDVGAGASTLVDDLIERGVKAVAVLDISAEALAVSKARLGQKAASVEWIEADVAQAKLRKEYFDIWHDRAVFHFLTDAEDRRRYIAVMREALKPRGQLVMATFGLEGPPKCSGLGVIRYSPQTLQTELGEGFRLIGTLEEAHQTPFHAVQKFIYCRFEKVDSQGKAHFSEKGGDRMSSLNLTRLTNGILLMIGLLFFKPLAYFVAVMMIFAGLTGICPLEKFFISWASKQSAAQIRPRNRHGESHS